MAIQEDPSQFQTSPSISTAPAIVPAAGYIEGGRTVDAGRAWEWIVEGYRIFRRQAGMWVVLTLIFFLLVFAFRIIPFIGWLLMTLLVPVLVGGVMIGCQAVERGAELELAHLFAGFRRNTGQLMLLGLITFGLTLAAMLPIVVLMGAGTLAGAMTGGIAGASVIGMSALLAILIALALFVPVNMGLWFAPALVVLQGETAPRAVVESFKACLKNIVPFLLYGVIVFVLAILAAIPFGLGWLVLAPVVFGSVYSAYRDIYFKR